MDGPQKNCNVCDSYTYSRNSPQWGSFLMADEKKTPVHMNISDLLIS